MPQGINEAASAAADTGRIMPMSNKDYGGNVDLAYGKHIFDIRGNRYRLICVIDFVRHGVLVLWVGTHGDYDRLNRNDGAGLNSL